MGKKIFLSLCVVFSLAAYTDDSYDDPIFHFYDSPTMINHHYIQPHHPQQSTVSYVLRLRFPPGLKKIPGLCGYYKGYRLNFNTDYCLVNEKSPSDTFTLVIADEVHRRWHNNTTKDLKRVGKKCRMFHITRKQDARGDGWDVEEEKPDNIPVILPKTSIVLIFDPDLVSGLKKDDGLMKIKTNGSVPLYLPIIEIAETLTEDKLNQVCAEACFAALDTRGIHCPISSCVKNDSSMIVAMSTLNS